MLSFENDYSEGAHPLLLRRLMETNLIQQPGYGEDEYTRSAREKIRAACDCPQGDVCFLAGGTQANQVIISALLHSTEGAVAADTGHIACHEAGAIEATGHKVLTLPAHEGKMDAGELRALLSAFWDDPNHAHMVYPGLVYISHPTEYGTLYTAEELRALSAVCRAYRIPLFLDGARLCYGLAAPGTDVTLPLLAKTCDCFTIGGTKAGALCGEAAVFPAGAPDRFLTHVKQRGALLAKGRLLGVQFDALFTDDLYRRIGDHAARMTERLRQIFAERGYPFHIASPTNQQFIVLTQEERAFLSERVRFSYWEPIDDNRAAVRFAVSWATEDRHLSALADILDEARKARKSQ